MLRSSFLAKTALILTASACFALAGCKSPVEKQADKNLSDMKSANSDVAATSAGKSNLPVECDAYITKVDSCVSKMNGNPAAAQFKQSMEAARNNWANIQDKTQLANACKQADAQFVQTSAALGCK